MGKGLHNALISAGVIVTGALLAAPEAVTQISPELVKAVVPAEYAPVVTGTLTFLAVIGKFIKSRKDKA